MTLRFTIILALLLATIFTAGGHSVFATGELGTDFNLCPEVPTLRCKNGSTCTPGPATFGLHEHLNMQTNDNGYHCKCNKGWTGHDCSTIVDECSGGSGTAACYNGSKCQKNGQCNCNDLNQNSASSGTKFAGDMCQHESTSFCASSLVGNHAPNHQFCTNHGTCKKMVMDGEPHPGCTCTSGWMGDHCEISLDPYSIPSHAKGSSSGGSNAGYIVLLTALILVICGTVAGIAFVIMKMRRTSDDGSEEVVFQTHMPGEGDKRAVSADMLDADGSGTLGKENGSHETFTIDDEEDKDEPPSVVDKEIV